MVTSINIPPSLLEKLKQRAKEDSRSLSSMVRILLVEALLETAD